MTDDRYGKIHTDGSRSGGQPLNDSIEAKALALVNEVRTERGGKYIHYTRLRRDHDEGHEALYRAIEQHEAFKQDVSDAVEGYLDGPPIERHLIIDTLRNFIIPKPKPDPLVEAMTAAFGEGYEQLEADNLRDMLDALGFEIREKGQ